MRNAKLRFLALTLILVSLVGGVLLGQYATITDKDIGALKEDFFGKFQSGISTPAQANLTLIAFDAKPGIDKSALGRWMRLWTNDAANLTQGKEVIGAVNPGMEKNPARLTATFGFGYELFKKVGIEWPLKERTIPKFETIDQLEDRWSGGDVVVQICGDDPLSVFNLGVVLKKDAEPFATM